VNEAEAVTQRSPDWHLLQSDQVYVLARIHLIVSPLLDQGFLCEQDHLTLSRQLGEGVQERLGADLVGLDGHIV
jgi:hypothetical protein